MKETPGILFLYCGLQVLLYSCLPCPRPPQTTPHPFPPQETRTDSQAAESNLTSPENQIIFVSLAIFQDTSRDNRIVRLEALVKKPGILKSSRTGSLSAGPYLKCTLLAGQQLLDTFLLEHPLFRNQEYVHDQHQMTWKAISLEQANFFIRFQQKGADHLKLEERLPGSQAKELIRIKL